MTTNDRLTDAFAEVLQIERAFVVDGLSYNSIKEWDSVAHMQLVAALEEAFEVMLDTDEIVDLSSVAKAKEILSRHGVVF